MKKLNPFIISVIGPTASGKSELAVQLAKKYNGEVISADSRQVYRGLSIGTGKILGTWQKTKHGRLFIYKNIPHHVIDFVSPKQQYSVAHFREDAVRALEHIYAQGKTPILCGGTAQFIDSLIFNQAIPQVEPDKKLRKQLEALPTGKLYQTLQKKDPARAATIDSHNRRRLIRALEIIYITGKPVPTLEQKSPYRCTWIGINPPQSVLHAKIEQRLEQRLKQGLIREVKQLHNKGLSWSRCEELGLEYRYVSRYLRKQLSRTEMYNQLLAEIKHYAKRQLTWWKRNSDINWFPNPTDTKIYSLITKKIKSTQ